MAFRMQEFIHKFEVGSGRPFLKTAAAAITMLSLLAVYDLIVMLSPRHRTTACSTDVRSSRTFPGQR